MKKSKSIFLIEDDKEDQEFFIDALNEIDGAVLFAVAHNGRTALDVLENVVNLPDIIFTDIAMPAMNGLECLAEIKKSPKLRGIPVVILTGSADQENRARELGAEICFRKTGNSKVLVEQIKQVTRSAFPVRTRPVPANFQNTIAAPHTAE
jgi:CheY-like chemotaxis protein